MNRVILAVCFLSTGVVAQSVTPVRVASDFVRNDCEATVNIIAPTQYSDGSAISAPVVYDIYEKACGPGISCRRVPWVQTVSKQLQGDITLSCAGKPSGHIYKGRPCNALDNTVCAGFSYFIIGGAN